MAKKKTAVADGTQVETPPEAIPLNGDQPAELSPSTKGTAVLAPPEAQPLPNGAVVHPDAEQQPSANGDKRHPVYKVGPIPTDRDNSVEAAVWDRVVQTRDGREFTVYNVTVQASWRDTDGAWKKTSNFRGSQIYALVYCLQRCSDWILAQRDPAANSPF